jgi:hypothetical protein
MRLKRIISGGQTGADRAALDAAIVAGLDHGGWAPNGLWAEDGPIAARYGLVETPSADVAQRTEWNVRDADATLIVASGPLAGGTALAQQCAFKHGKPSRQFDPRGASRDHLAADMARWLAPLDGDVLNVAGPRASQDPGLYDLAFAALLALFTRAS